MWRVPFWLNSLLQVGHLNCLTPNRQEFVDGLPLFVIWTTSETRNVVHRKKQTQEISHKNLKFAQYTTISERFNKQSLQ